MRVLPENKKGIANRFSRLEGQLRAVRRMIEADEDCEKVVTLLGAIHAALQGVSRLVVKDYLWACLQAAREPGPEGEENLERLVALVLDSRTPGGGSHTRRRG